MRDEPVAAINPEKGKDSPVTFVLVFTTRIREKGVSDSREAR